MFFDGMALGLLAPLGALVVARGEVWKKVVGGLVVVGLIRVAGYYGFYAELAFVYVHNLVAVLLWWWWRERAGWWHWLPLGMFWGGDGGDCVWGV